MPQSNPPIPCFVELPPFERYRGDYLDDEAYRQLQTMLLANPDAGAVIRGTGGLRKVRFEDKQRDIFKALLDQELAKRAKPKGKPTRGKVK